MKNKKLKTRKSETKKGTKFTGHVLRRKKKYLLATVVNTEKHQRVSKQRKLLGLHKFNKREQKPELN